jgi:hypothetical protein
MRSCATQGVVPAQAHGIEIPGAGGTSPLASFRRRLLFRGLPASHETRQQPGCDTWSRAVIPAADGTALMRSRYAVVLVPGERVILEAGAVATDVVVVDVSPADTSALALAHALRELPDGPAVVLTSSNDRSEFGKDLDGFGFKLGSAPTGSAPTATTPPRSAERYDDRRSPIRGQAGPAQRPSPRRCRSATGHGASCRIAGAVRSRSSLAGADVTVGAASPPRPGGALPSALSHPPLVDRHEEQTNESARAMSSHDTPGLVGKR